MGPGFYILDSFNLHNLFILTAQHFIEPEVTQSVIIADIFNHFAQPLQVLRSD